MTPEEVLADVLGQMQTASNLIADTSLADVGRSIATWETRLREAAAALLAENARLGEERECNRYALDALVAAGYVSKERAEVARSLWPNVDCDIADAALAALPAPTPGALDQDESDDAAEAAYWRFDARRKGYGEWATTPQSERDAFKAEYRAIAFQPKPKEVLSASAIITPTCRANRTDGGAWAEATRRMALAYFQYVLAPANAKVEWHLRLVRVEKVAAAPTSQGVEDNDAQWRAGYAEGKNDYHRDSQNADDEQRMDWLESQAHALTWDDGQRIAIRADDGAEFKGETWRDCIDAALGRAHPVADGGEGK